jgi:hypothetical protein
VFYVDEGREKQYENFEEMDLSFFCTFWRIIFVGSRCRTAGI